MPFTHSYASSAIAARSRQDKGANGAAGSSSNSNSKPRSDIHILNSDSSRSVDASSSRYQSSLQSATRTASPSASEHDSAARSRLFSSGRKSPDPFRRFRRLSSSNSLNIVTAPPALDSSQSFDSQQQQRHFLSSAEDSQIPSYPATSRRAPSPAPLHTPRSAPPPLPSSSTKPVLQRPKRTKSSSISILSTGLGLRSRDNHHLESSSDVDIRRRHRKSASLSSSDVDFSSSALDARRAVTPQPMLRPASPSPSFSESVYSVHHDRVAAPSSLPPGSTEPKSKQHKQAWYQAQQKTIELENPSNRGAQHSDSDSARLFPLNVAVTDHVGRGQRAPTESRSPRPVVETFLSEEEMLAAGIHIIRRRDADPATSSPSSKDSACLPTPRMTDQAAMPAMPPRLCGADHPDFLELIDSPVDRKSSGPLLEQLVDPSASSASMQRALSHSRNKSSNGSLSISSASSTDYLPHSTNNLDDVSSLHNGSTGSLSSGSKHSFSFAKLRRAGSKQENVAGSPRPSTANSSSEDISSNRPFLFPSRSQSSAQQQQSQHNPSSHGSAAAPGYLTPGPGPSASPFLNKHSATVGRASRSTSTGDTAKNGLAQVFNGRGSSAATVGASSAGAYHAPSRSNGLPPPKPPKPKPSLLKAFPRSSGGESSSTLGSVSAPNTSKESLFRSPRNNGLLSGDMLQPPASAGAGNGVYRNIAHSCSQEAVAKARLDAEALRTSAGTPLPPPRRLNQTRGGFASAAAGGPGGLPAMGRTISGSGGGGVVGALGHVGQLGAAVGRRGWDFMKTLQNSNSNPSGVVASSGRFGGGGGDTAGYRNGSYSAAENEPTRQWLLLLDGPDSAAVRAGPGSVFGAPLQDVVLRSRLSSINSEGNDQLGVPDLGQEFSANFLLSPRSTPRASVAGAAASEPLSREEARHLFLPRVVVRCIQSLEKWGPSEEGIYRISGRSSHTVKLRSYFSDPRNDLRLDEINPADLDINSVCSLLKSYLRELPEPLIPLAQSQALDQAVGRLLADAPDAAALVAAAGAGSGSGGKATEARTANMDANKVANELSPLMRQLSIHNWYLLRELTEHLGMLAQPDVVARTKMPISNLTLVLAPTVSISLPVLQVLVRYRQAVFVGPLPVEDFNAVAPSSVAGASVTAVGPPASALVKEQELQQSKRTQPPPKPAKPEKLESPSSRLPVTVRKRASSMGLGALLSSPTRKTAAAAAEDTKRQHHRRTPSTTPSIELPAYLAEAAAASRPTSPSPTSPSFASHDPYERPSTSLGHFSELASSRPSHPTLNRDRFGGSRDAARRFNALALHDDRSSSQQRRTAVTVEETTPIARYYARIREEAERQREREQRGGPAAVQDEGGERDGAKTPLGLGASSSLSSMPVSAATPDRGELRRYWAEKTASPTSSVRSPILGTSGGFGGETSSDAGANRSGRTSALDRPRPPTSSSASFFAGRSRRQDSANGLGTFTARPSGSSSSIPKLVARSDSASSSHGDVGERAGTRPLRIVKKSSGGSGGSGSGTEKQEQQQAEDEDVEDVETTPRMRCIDRMQGEDEPKSGDVEDQIARYLINGPRRV
ncbi:hypothetical protein EX895_002660 [Sporisorium graminicola]|uniref:Rho-GAP domain-containing protein n=1 Tax=Sporisorium graminicola TaxID=280036 RepID=A0A4U7KY17_9BASI|nr:hypothetical protein EX895_002660 [Sporisorium graminicola]TKY88308.1 hypothetical protein EX895_002660 [Sporisorium graminicola]